MRLRISSFQTSILLSALAVIIGVFVWRDNRIGFRDAGDFAELLAAVFGMISVIWLVAAVLLQREELALQRHELSLQREEVKRLADETYRQASLMNEQLLIEHKTNFVGELRSFLLSEEARMPALMKAIEVAIDTIACATVECERNNATVKRYFGSDNVLVVLTKKETGEELEASVRYAEVAKSIPANPRVSRAHKFWKRCRKVGLGYWFRGDLPHAVGPVGSLTVYQIMAFNNVCARARKGLHS